MNAPLNPMLLARLDLARIRVNPPPLRQALVLVLVALVGASIGRLVAA